MLLVKMKYIIETLFKCVRIINTAHTERNIATSVYACQHNRECGNYKQGEIIMQMAVMLVVLSVSSSHGNGFDRKDNFISGASGDTSSTGTTQANTF